MRRGFTLIEVLIVLAIIVILATLLIPNLLRARISANEANAQATLSTLATAFEQYANDNDGNYPTDISNLTGANPPYLHKDVTSGTFQGYTFTCTLDTTGYNCTATPVSCGKTGSKIFNVTIGKSVSSTECTP